MNSATVDETTPLVPNTTYSAGSQSYSIWRSLRKPQVAWIIPFWLIAAIARGMTLAPRVEVYTNLACEALATRTSHALTPSPNAPGWSGTMAPLSESPLPWDPSSALTLSFVTTLMGDDQADEDDPWMSRAPRKQCLKDPEVQKYAAQLQTIVILVMGVLSTITTGWWGSLGDRLGRTKIMFFSLFGYLFTDVMFLVIALNAKRLAPYGGHKLLILGPVVEGALGGWNTLMSAVNAYVSDVTAHGSRASIFSTVQGVLFCGVALGPAIGSFILTQTPDILIIFFAAVALSLCNCLYALLVIPESLSSELREEVQRKRLAERFTTPTNSVQNTQSNTETGVLFRIKKAITEFFKPITLFAPTTTNWSLTFLAFAYFALFITAGTYPMKLMYAEHVFGWTALDMANYLSFVGTARAFNLLVTLPAVIKMFKPVPVPEPTALRSKVPSPASTTSITAVDGDSSQASSTALEEERYRRVMEDWKATNLENEIRFDANLARISFAVDAIGYLLIVLTNTPNAFVMATVMSSFGGGSGPAIQSLALCFLSDPQKDAGRLFGAFAMMSSTASFILSPGIFGVMYSLTVKTYPKAIFASGMGLLVVGVLCLLLVHPRRRPKPKTTRLARPRGRPTKAKPLSGSRMYASAASSRSVSTVASGQPRAPVHVGSWQPDRQILD